MITTRQIDEIIDAILDRIEVLGNNMDELYPDLPISDRNELVSIIKDIIGDE